MDVRCEKCQTEYELDEARLKPGGVTVKCTNCGHMFKIRKRTITNVGLTPGITGAPTIRDATVRDAAPPTVRDASPGLRARTASSKPMAPAARRDSARDSMLDDDARQFGPDEAPTTVDRQWLIRLENGEQKSCRELATLQQWIIAGVVTRESLISRTGKTWKRIGDIADLHQYFEIADEARASRESNRSKPPSRPSPPHAGAPITSIKEIPGTIPGYGAAQAAGGTILPDDDDAATEARPTRAYQQRPPANTPPPVPTRAHVRTPPAVPIAQIPSGTAPTELASGPAAQHPQAASASPSPSPSPSHQPPPPRPARPTPPPPPPRRAGAPAQPPAIPGPTGNRATAAWATDGIKPDASELPADGPFVGKLKAAPDGPAFAGRVRIAPGDGSAFDPGRVRIADDDDDVLPARRSSRAGMWVLIMALVVMASAAAVVYMFVLRTGEQRAGEPVKDAAAVAVVAPDAAPVAVVAAPDAAAVEAVPALAAPRAELAADLEPRLRTAAQSLDGKLDAPSQALRAQLTARLAQDLLDRAALMATPDADVLRREANQLVLDAATEAQRALRTAGDDPGANIAMAEVLRLQRKPARDIKRYLDTARARPDKDWAVDLALSDALILLRDGKAEEARAAFAAIDQADGKLETSGDVRARFHTALALAALGKPADAKPLVETILAAQPEHAGARALAAKLETAVAKSDPLPPEEGAHDGSASPGPKAPAPVPAPSRPVATPNPTPAGGARPPAAGTGGAVPESGGGDTYDRLLARANALADTSCAKAMDLYAKALEQKPNGVEALAGLGYCQIDAKQFSSAFSKFRAALAVSPKYEPALRGIAETYQQQGRKEQAIEAYKRYLEVYPDSAAAKKQLERLGGDTQSPSPPAAGNAPPAAPPASPPAAPPASPPPAAPADPGAGSGSG